MDDAKAEGNSESGHMQAYQYEYEEAQLIVTD